jgi:uncharacterized protein (TIGR00369 family)
MHFGSADHDGPAERLAAALRGLMDAAVLTSADPHHVEAVTAEVELLAQRLRGPDGELLTEHMTWEDDVRLMRGDRADNPVIGRANPLSPPMSVRALDDGTVVSELTMRPIYEGPPGLVHGGFIAALFDQLLGVANTANGHGGMTAELTVRYRRPTPLGVPLTFRARVDSVSGRRIHSSGEVLANGAVTAEATGLFITPSRSFLAELRQTVNRADEDGKSAEPDAPAAADAAIG